MPRRVQRIGIARHRRRALVHAEVRQAVPRVVAISVHYAVRIREPPGSIGPKKNFPRSLARRRPLGWNQDGLAIDPDPVPLQEWFRVAQTIGCL